MLPNAYTPLAFLPQTLANQYETSAFIFVAGLSAYLWDWLMATPDEYRFLRQTGFSASNATYFLSRFGTLAYCLTATVFRVGLVAHCRAILYVSAASYIIAVPATSWLFFSRVRAIWNNSKIVTASFGVLWLGILATAALVPLAVDGVHIGTTQRCINTAVRVYVTAPIFLTAFNDTLVFITISVRIVAFTCAGDTWRMKFKSFANGDGLSRLSTGLLQNGQGCYFATVGTSLIMSAIALSPSIPPIYRPMLAFLSIVVENSMACRVFRNVKLGYIENDPRSFWAAIPTNRPPFSSAEERVNVGTTKTTESCLPVALAFQKREGFETPVPDWR
jgi:hypothetical protein